MQTAEDWAVRTSLISGDKRRCTKRIVGTAPLVALVVGVKIKSSSNTYLVIGHERRKKNGHMTTTKGTDLWSYVKQTFHNS